MVALMILKRSAVPVSDEVKEDILRKIRERNNRLYPSDWDFYEDGVANSPTDPCVSAPHRQTGKPVGINLFTDTLDDIMAKCGFPEAQRETVLRFYRSHLQDRLPYWDAPNSIPLLDE